MAQDNALDLRSEDARPLPTTATRTRSLQFRNFELRPRERLLLKNGDPVAIGCRAFDLLYVLLQHAGAIVSKEVIFKSVWPSITVEESNLRWQVARLRKALGDASALVKTVQGRGYFLAADVRWVDDENSLRSASAAASAYPDKASYGRSGGCSDRQQPTIAIVDDDEATREALKAFFHCNRMRSIGFSCAEELMQKIHVTPFNCIVLDVFMPGSSGLDIQAELVRCGCDAPIIFMSGRSDVPISVRAMKAGAVEFLTKPVRHDELLSAICRAIMHSAVTFRAKFPDGSVLD